MKEAWGEGGKRGSQESGLKDKKQGIEHSIKDEGMAQW